MTKHLIVFLKHLAMLKILKQGYVYEEFDVVLYIFYQRYHNLYLNDIQDDYFVLNLTF